jgi:hypothetical protein
VDTRSVFAESAEDPPKASSHDRATLQERSLEVKRASLPILVPQPGLEQMESRHGSYARHAARHDVGHSRKRSVLREPLARWRGAGATTSDHRPSSGALPISERRSSRSRALARPAQGRWLLRLRRRQAHRPGARCPRLTPRVTARGIQGGVNRCRLSAGHADGLGPVAIYGVAVLDPELVVCVLRGVGACSRC